MKTTLLAASLSLGLAASLLAPAARADGFDLRPLLVSELDFRGHSAKELEGEDGFALARLRAGAQVTFTSWFRTQVQLELAKDEGPTILDAFAAVSPSPEWEISLGAAQTPLFTSARDEPLWSLPVPELTMVARAFWPAYDLGLEVHRLPTKRLPVEGWLRFGNGSGSALGNDNSDYAIDARLDVALGRAAPPDHAPRGPGLTVTGVAPKPGPRELLGLRFGAGFHAESALDRLGITGRTADGFSFYRPVTVSGARYVVEGHLVGYAGPVKVTVEAAFAKENRSADTDGNPDTPRQPLAPVHSRGGSVEAAWMIVGPWRRHGQWPVDTPIGAWDWGALEVAGRAERLELGRGAKDVAPGGATAGSAALRWWATSFCALSAAGYYTAYDAPPVEEPKATHGWMGLGRATVRLPY